MMSGNRDMCLAAIICLIAFTPVAVILAASMKPPYAVAAERVLDPDRIYAAATAPASLEPPLLADEALRYPTRYSGKKDKLKVEWVDLYRGNLVLVNNSHPLPEEYEPENLIVINDALDYMSASGLSVSKSQMLLNQSAGEYLEDLANAAYEESRVRGYLLLSGYRDFAYQSNLHQRKIQEYRAYGYGEAEAVNAAAFWVARPRQSEHHTGLAMDVTSRSHPELTPSFAYTENGSWLAEHCRRFGFIIRYPESKSGITMVGFEPWHIRYVGKPHCELIASMSWCLEEYLEFLATEGGATFKDAQGAIWQIDYDPLGDGVVEVPADLPYTISGDGDGGFIITARLE